MTTIDYGWTPYSKLKRDQLLTLAYALEDMRDRAIRRYEAAEAVLEQVRELAVRYATQPNDYDEDTEAEIAAGRAILALLDGEATHA